jgi:cytochrome P450
VTDTSAITLDQVDLADHDSFLEAVPYDMFALLRREDPVHWQEEENGSGFWCVTRHADISAVHRDWETFSSEVGGSSLQDLAPDEIEARKSMLDMDPPRHNQLRAIINKGFTPRAVRAYELKIRELFDTILDHALEMREFDFVEHVASELPMRVFAEMLGAPQEDRRHIVSMGDRILGFSDPEYATPEELERHRHLPFSSPVSLEMFEYGRKLADQRRKEPRDDIITKLVQAEIDGQALTQQEFDVFFILLATAGNETTRHTISSSLLAFMEQPEQIQRLKDDPELLPKAAEEMLRWACPVHHFRRTATRDVEFGGKLIRQGDKVVTWLSSGNRDEAIFDEPDRFDVGRDPNPHMTFGPGGVHFCLGAHLARLEVRIVYEELVPRLHRFSLNGPVERLRSNFFNGIKRLPVKVTPA